ncbi:MAG: 2,3-bisphosphoglycerate-independent phosphoglycerate mutase, partial [Actinomycetia bacterium]|nr:2,3-bisphosphoglycerate-independent phosphoglycerate mutase [Actinomycetes bacterium]
MRTPALLAILDGIGIAPDSPSNAVTRADAPFLHELMSDTSWPCVQLQASGRAVGLPDGQMGNSEVGHLNIGAGRVVNQELTRIDLACEDGSLLANPVLVSAFQRLVARAGQLHLAGLCSNGGVHSRQQHMEAVAEMAAGFGVQGIALHAFLDGRDVALVSGAGFVQQARDFLHGLSERHPGCNARIASIGGRYWGMDRDKRWERVQRAWRAMVTPTAEGVLHAFGADPVELVRQSYEQEVFDEFVEPQALDGRGVVDGDLVLFFNFRPDRARELSSAFLDPGFDGFERPVVPKVDYLCMTEYDPAFAAELGAEVVFPKSFPKNVLADYLASLGLKQLHIAETEKYAHVTFFFNGGIEAAKPGEQRILVPSPKVATYDLQPQMSAPEVTAQLVAAIEGGVADVYIVNYANGDMVGHTGVQSAAEAAVAAVDRGLCQVIAAIQAAGGVALVTADHGNADVMQDAEGHVWTAHSLSPVPLVLICPEAKRTASEQSRAAGQAAAAAAADGAAADGAAAAGAAAAAAAAAA